MEYTDQEKKLAQSVVNNQELLNLLAKIFIGQPERFSEEFATLPNNELGEMVKADILADKKIKMRFSQLKRLGTKVTSSGRGVPK